MTADPTDPAHRSSHLLSGSVKAIVVPHSFFSCLHFSNKNSTLHSFVHLLAATPVLFVATELWALPVAAWIAPVLLLRFVRTSRAGRCDRRTRTCRHASVPRRPTTDEPPFRLRGDARPANGGRGGGVRDVVRPLRHVGKRGLYPAAPPAPPPHLQRPPPRNRPPGPNPCPSKPLYNPGPRAGGLPPRGRDRNPLRNPRRCRCLGLHAGAAPAGRGRAHPFVEGRRQDVRARRRILIGAVLERSRSPGARDEDRRERSGPLVLSPFD